MTTFSTGGSAVTFTTAGTSASFTTSGSVVSFSTTGTAVSFAVTASPVTFTLPAAVEFAVSSAPATFTVGGNYGPQGSAGPAGADGSSGTVTLSGDVTGAGMGTVVTTLASSGVAAGFYGGQDTSVHIGVDAKGRVTLAAGSAISIPAAQVQGTAVLTADSRLTDARTPTAHATSHGAGGSDPITTLGTVTITRGTITTGTYGTVTQTALNYTGALTSSAQQQIDAKAPINGPTFTGTVTATTGTITTLTGSTATFSAGATIGTVANLQFTYIGSLTSSAQAQLDGKAAVTHASTHGAGGADPITTLGTVLVSSLSGTVVGTMTGGTVAASAGAAATPSHTFVGDTNTGMYLAGVDSVGISTAGTARVVIDASGNVNLNTSANTQPLVVNTTTQTDAGNVSTAAKSALLLTNASGGVAADGALGPAIAFSGVNTQRRRAMIASIQTNADEDLVGMAFYTHQSALTTNDTVVEVVRINHAGQITTGLGSAGTPVLSFSGDTNTGIYSPGADQVGIATAGTAALTISATQTATFGSAVYGPLGAVGAPTYSFTGDTNTGIYSSAADTVNIAAGGTAVMQVTSAGLITGTGSLGAWVAYTPTLGGFTPGSGTPTAGVWCQIGKIIHFRAVWTFGAGSAGASARPTLTLPATAKNATGANVTATFFDTSATAYYQAVAYQTSTTVVTMGVQGALGVSDLASTTSPFTWATGDTITLAGTYELA